MSAHPLLRRRGADRETPFLAHSLGVQTAVPDDEGGNTGGRLPEVHTHIRPTAARLPGNGLAACHPPLPVLAPATRANAPGV